MKKPALHQLLIMLVIGCAGHSQTIAPNYEVGTWRGFRSVAVTYTFDDACSNQFALAIPMFNEHDFNLTLFTATATDWIGTPDWTNLQEAADQGHEIASHTVTHTNMSGMGDSLQTFELEQSKADIEAHITGQKCITVAYPYCVSAKKSICEQHYIAGRICSGNLISRNPTDFMNLSSFVCGDQGSTRTAKDFMARARSAIKSRGWAVHLLHGIDNDGGWSPVASEELRASLDSLSANSDKFWVETFGNVVRYIKERNAVSVSETSVLDSRITVQMTDELDDEIYDYPVTIRRLLPDGWPSATASQNGLAVPYRMVESDVALFIEFDVVPDGGDILLSRSNESGVRAGGGITAISPVLSQNYPNPFNPSTTLHFSLAAAGNVTLKVFNALGKEVQTLIRGRLPAGSHSAVFRAEGLESGVYFCRLEDGAAIQYRKMLLLK